MTYPLGTEPATALRSAGLRVTAPRVATLHELAALAHTDVDGLTNAVRARLGGVSTQAIYDVLRVLTDAGLVRRIEPAGSPALFEIDSGDNHHHLVCRGCGTLLDVPCAVGERGCLVPATDHGFVIDEAEVVFWGYCPACQQISPPTSNEMSGP